MATGLDVISNFVDANGQVEFELFVEAVIAIGIDFSNVDTEGIGGIEFFIVDYDDSGTSGVPTDDSGTRIALGAQLVGSNLDLLFQPFGIGISDGTLALDADGDYSTDDFAIFDS